MKTLLVPTRANLIGAWSDQLCWKGPAAVVNFALGWHDPEGDPYGGQNSLYPCSVVNGHFQTRVFGVGTGLGISSICVAAEQYARDPRINYVHAALEWERINGVKGGWQDPVGAMDKAPGFKLITTRDHRKFSIQRRDTHPIMDRMVLFDTKIRRESRTIGEKIRTLMEAPGHFSDTLTIQVEKCESFFNETNPEWAVGEVLANWRLMVGYVPEMAVEMPKIPGTYGHHILLGAGGGGFGLMFTDGRSSQEDVRGRLLAAGYPAYIPVVLPGPVWAEESAADGCRITTLQGNVRERMRAAASA